MRKTTILLAVIVGLTSCKNNKVSIATNPSMDSTTSAKQAYLSINFSNKKDPVCGMPLKAEIGDSTNYNGKTIAFCSKECKEEFVKNPSGYNVK